MSNAKARRARSQEPERPEHTGPAPTADAGAGGGAGEEPTPRADQTAEPTDVGPGPETAVGAEPEEGREEPAPVDPEEVTALREALIEAERQRDEYLDLLRRERAEFDNFRKRSAREQLQAMERGVESVMADLLGVLDNFEHVLDAAEESVDQPLAKGIAMVHTELMAVLERLGLETVPGEGNPFDPQWHDAMMQVPADEPQEHPVVAQVLRTGYRFKGRVLRPASVSVAQ